MIKRINRKQILILKACAKYKFLTYAQVTRLWIEKHKSNISKLFKDLRESKRPLVRKIPHRNGEPAKHYLTNKGKEVLMELYSDLEETEIHVVPNILYTDTQDQKHRCTTIDIQIELDFACQKHEVDLLFCDRYFDTVGNNRVEKNLKSKTAFVYEGKKSVKPDIVFMLQTTKQKELYVVELENGKDTKKAIEKCIRHGKAILNKSANQKYNFEIGYRTLWVFEYSSIMQATMDKLRANPFFRNMNEYFLFKPLKDLHSDFFENRVNISGQERKLYYM